MQVDEIKKKYFDYATGVVDGTIPACSYIISSCKRNLSRFDRDDMYFDPDVVDRVINFCQHLKLYTGEWAGKNLKLEDWQRNIIANVFGWKWCKNDLRVTRTLYLELGRKNSKTTTCAALLLYMMIADGENNASVILAANSAKQASLCFDICSNLLKSIDPKDKYFKRYRDTIKFDKTVSKIKVVAADATKLDGENAHAFLCDELHTSPNANVWNVLETSMGSRRQPLAIAATTAGLRLDSFCYSQRDYYIQLLNGVINDDTLQPYIYTIDDDDDWRDENVWIKANPNLDVSIKREYIRGQIEKAKANPALEISIRTKLINQWCTTSNGSYIPMTYVLNAMDKINLDDWRNKDIRVKIGLDLSSVIDVSAIAMVWEYEGRYYIYNKYYLPASALKESVNKEKYRQWQNQGVLTITEGNSIDFEYIKDDILRLCNDFNVDVINYDPWQSTYLIQKLTEQGLPLNPYSQSIGSMSRPSKELLRLCLDGKIVLDKNPMTLWMYECATPYYDVNENLKIKKTNYERDKIDGVVADVMGLAGILDEMGYSNEISSVNF